MLIFLIICDMLVKSDLHTIKTLSENLTLAVTLCPNSLFGFWVRMKTGPINFPAALIYNWIVYKWVVLNIIYTAAAHHVLRSLKMQDCFGYIFMCTHTVIHI